MVKILRVFSGKQGRGPYLIGAIWSLYCDLQMVAQSRGHSAATYWMAYALTAMYVMLWPFATFARLNSIGWNRWWAVVFAIPWIAFYFIGKWANVWWAS